MKPNRRFIGAALASASLLGAAATLSPAMLLAANVAATSKQVSCRAKDAIPALCRFMGPAYHGRPRHRKTSLPPLLTAAWVQSDSGA